MIHYYYVSTGSRKALFELHTRLLVHVRITVRVYRRLAPASVPARANGFLDCIQQCRVRSIPSLPPCLCLVWHRQYINGAYVSLSVGGRSFGIICEDGHALLLLTGRFGLSVLVAGLHY